METNVQVQDNMSYSVSLSADRRGENGSYVGEGMKDVRGEGQNRLWQEGHI